jgi:hypothetical protein
MYLRDIFLLQWQNIGTINLSLNLFLRFRRFRRENFDLDDLCQTNPLSTIDIPKLQALIKSGLYLSEFLKLYLQRIQHEVVAVWPKSCVVITLLCSNIFANLIMAVGLILKLPKKC